jgi:hypothetical protein
MGYGEWEAGRGDWERTMTHLPVMSFRVTSGGAAIVRID